MICEHSFSVLKNIMRDRKKSIKNAREASSCQNYLLKLLDKKLKSKSKEMIFRKVNILSGRLELF